jgi:hypothetical protein
MRADLAFQEPRDVKRAQHRMASHRGAGEPASYPKGNAFTTWLMASAFYVAADVLDGALVGLLRPLRRRYSGRLGELGE